MLQPVASCVGQAQKGCRRQDDGMSVGQEAKWTCVQLQQLHAVNSHVEAALMQVPMFSIILMCTVFNHVHCNKAVAQLY